MRSLVHFRTSTHTRTHTSYHAPSTASVPSPSVQVTEFQIAVTVDEAKGDAAGAEDAVDGLPDRVRLDLLANDVTYRRLSDVLAAMGSYNYGGAARLVGM